MNSQTVFKNIKFVTGNPNKVREAGEILGVDLEQVNVPEMHELQTNDLTEIVEHKVRQAYQAVNGPVLVEDSGLVFSAWNGLPGALVKWFETTVGCAGMLKMLESFDDREAFALCTVGYHDGETIKIARGEVRGRVADGLKGSNGFGWDVFFIPEGYERTYAEMPAEEKNAISHRKRAFEALKKLI
ncbi:MAG: non-canonical purine NTP pyrophosphatase, RdgB/HAM1 family [Nitrospinaceae bacterium]|nr:MAG: non-canonical purine NTP pyrophosphatase, RdgB/HAM1 family [Nitrospinaceae bacterium]